MTKDFVKRDWREIALHGNWRDLCPEDYQGLEAADRAELISELQRYLPKHAVGHGLETREGYLHPRKAKGPDQIIAAVALFKLQREIDRERDPKDRILGEAIELAKQVVGSELGIHEYHGLLATYLQQLPDGNFRQIDISGQEAGDDLGRPVTFWGRKPAGLDELQLRYVLGEVNCAYGAKSVQTLAGFWKLGSFELNSPVDHAVSILDAALRIEILVDYSLKPAGVDREDDSIVWELVEHSFEIGRHFDALVKKKVEVLAQQKLQHTEKNRANGSRGGQAKKRELRFEVLGQLAILDKKFYMKSTNDGDGVLMFVEKKQAIARAIKLAEQYDSDRSPEEKLFSTGGKPLSKKWYENWWDDFRTQQKVFY